jgi:hypothetical protein
MDVDEKREATLIHDDTRHQNTRQLFIMNFEGAESPMSVVHLCVLFVCRFMVFEFCNSMKMNFCIGFSDGMGLLLQLGWLLNEGCESCSGRLVGARD